MPELEKFLFDFDFDDVKLMEEIVREEAEEEGIEPEEPEEPPEPTFSQEELEAARQEGFNRGKAEGNQEAMNAIEKELVGVVGQLNEQVSDIHQVQADNLEEFHRETATLALAICRKLFPVLNEQGGFDEVANAAEKIMTSLLNEPRLSVRVQEEYAAPLKDRIEMQLSQSGYRGKLSVKGDSSLQNGELRVDWQSGYAKRDPNELLEEISEIVDKRIEFGALPEVAEEAASPEQPEPAGMDNVHAPEEGNDAGEQTGDDPDTPSDETETATNA